MSNSPTLRTAAVMTAVLCLQSTAVAQNDDAKIAFFESKIRPVLIKECYSCHSAEAVKTKKLRGGLQLDTREGIRKGGDAGPAVVPGDPKKSFLFAKIEGAQDDFTDTCTVPGCGETMPPGTKLGGEQRATIRTWIEQGAKND